jgi:RimJ/RimL family protein N-acetyltransferase
MWWAMLDYRAHRVPLVGSLITLQPVAPEHAEALVALRSTPIAQHIFAQTEPPSLGGQQRFYESYLQRANDLYWVVERHGQIIGANALYDINAAGAEKGRQIIEPTAARTLPIALEAELLLLDFAFGTLGLPVVTALVREDNQAVQNFNLRLGFTQSGSATRHGQTYPRYSLAAKDYNPAALRPIITYWATRMATPR